jgi:hypothetical protein
MRYSQFLIAENLIAVEKYVDINRPRGIGKTRHSAEFNFNFFGQTQKLLRAQLSRDTTYSIEKKRLILVAYGLSFINAGNLLYDQVL